MYHWPNIPPPFTPRAMRFWACGPGGWTPGSPGRRSPGPGGAGPRRRSRPGCSDSLPESLLPSRCATPTLAVRRFDRGSGHVGLGYAVCPVGTAWVGKRFWRSELRASSSCPIRCVISPKWAIPPPIWPTREAPSAASSSDAPGGGENAMISESIEPSGTSMPSLKYALIARAVCSP